MQKYTIELTRAELEYVDEALTVLVTENKRELNKRQESALYVPANSFEVRVAAQSKLQQDVRRMRERNTRARRIG
jgi:hypothetical protein